MSARRGQRSRAGLTLIEVLLALAILGVGLSVLVASAGRAMSVVKQVRHFTTARHLLDILDLEQPIEDLAALMGITESGGFESPNDAYSWERSVEPMINMEDEETEYFIVRSRILWSDRGRSSFEERVTGQYAVVEAEGVLPGMEEIDTDADSGDGGVRATGDDIRAGAPMARGGNGRRAAGVPGAIDGGMSGGGAIGAAGRNRGRQGAAADMIRGAQGGGFPQRGSIRSGAGRAFANPGGSPGRSGGGSAVGYIGPLPQDYRGGPPVPGR